MVRYEINGQRYSYNTNNREQVEEARRRLAAANAAYAAWLKAQAERASNPLARVLGSPTQREATEAQARLRHVLSSSPPAGPAAGSETGRGVAAAERMRVAREPRKEAIPGFVPRAEPEHPGKPHKVAARPKPSAPVGDGRKARHTEEREGRGQAEANPRNSRVCDPVDPLRSRHRHQDHPNDRRHGA